MQKPWLLNILKGFWGRFVILSWRPVYIFVVKDPGHSNIVCKNSFRSISWQVYESLSFYLVGRLVTVIRWPLHMFRPDGQISRPQKHFMYNAPTCWALVEHLFNLCYVWMSNGSSTFSAWWLIIDNALGSFSCFSRLTLLRKKSNESLTYVRWVEGACVFGLRRLL